MSFFPKVEGQEYEDPFITLYDPDNSYTVESVCKILTLAEAQGHPINAGSYLEQMTLKQIDNLTQNQYDS